MRSINSNGNNNSINAMILSCIRVLTIMVNILSSAILSRALDLDQYGTYSAGKLIVSICVNITIMGMADAANYFYHQKVLPREDCINTIYFIQVMIGLVCAAAILAGQRLITAYFNNPMLYSIYIYIAFRPLLETLASSLQTLQMSIGKARAVGLRNAMIALGKLAAVCVTAAFSNSIVTIFIAFLFFEILTVLYYYNNFRKAAFPIRPYRFRKELMKPILKFAVPMGLYVLTDAFSRDIDKLVIARFASTEQLAIYTNCATLLPFTIFSSSFLTVIIPIMTRLIHQNELERGRRLFRAYLNVSIISTFTFAVVCIILSEEIIRLLYGEKYLSGKWIFIIYTLADVAKVASLSLVLSAKGQTKRLMKISCSMLAVNVILNLLLYYLFGMLGPAIATVLVMLATTVILLNDSAKILGTNIRGLVDVQLVRRMLVLLTGAGVIGVCLRDLLNAWNVHYILVIAIVGGLLCGGLLLLNVKQIKKALSALNQERVEG